jgi:GntR family transcriptional regulator, transcriptional repressor for pyruvate dehydrogenase complex
LLEALKENEKSLSEQVSDRILQMIIDHNIASGEKLPNEFELARVLNVGRGTVREAVKLLVSRNVLEISRGKGTFVAANPGVSGDPFGLVFYKDQYKLTLDLVEIRLILEPEIAALAAVRASQAEVDHMKYLCDEVMRLATKNEEYIHLDTELHVSIAKSTGNLIMPNIIPVINKGIELYNQFPRHSELISALSVHQEIIDAISKHDENGARNAMLKHLQYNKRNLDHLKDKYMK